MGKADSWPLSVASALGQEDDNGNFSVFLNHLPTRRLSSLSDSSRWAIHKGNTYLRTKAEGAPKLN